MSIDLKTSKPQMYTTVLDVVLFSSIIKTDKLNFDVNDDPSLNSPPVLGINDVENYIIKADSLINSYLKSLYSIPSDLIIDSWATPPRHKIQNSVNKDALLGVKVNDAEAYTAYYTVKFTSNTDFTVTSSLEGNQGSGNKSSDFTTSNNAVIIGNNSWDSDISTSANDEFYFSIINCYPIIHTISTMLSASMILSEKYSEQIPNENDYPAKLWKKAMDLLINLADPESSVSLTELEDYNGETTFIDYRINALGEDVSDYLTENNLDI